LKKDEPSFNDYLAAGALANVPLWIYVLLLTLDVNKYSFSDLTVFYTIVPITTMFAGGFIASFLLFRRSGKTTLRIGLLVGVTATIVNFAFGLVTSGMSVFAFAAFCFMTSSILATVLKQKSRKDL
jgi:hypothetical protein